MVFLACDQSITNMYLVIIIVYLHVSVFSSCIALKQFKLMTVNLTYIVIKAFQSSIWGTVHTFVMTLIPLSIYVM